MNNFLLAFLLFDVVLHATLFHLTWYVLDYSLREYIDAHRLREIHTACHQIDAQEGVREPDTRSDTRRLESQ